MADFPQFPLPSQSFVVPRHRHPDPIPTNTVPGELHQIRAYIEATRIRVRYLEGLLEPSIIDEVTEIKRAMMDTHRTLERLQRRANQISAAVLMGAVTVEMWQAYQRLVKLEERLRGRRIDGRRMSSYVPTGVRRLSCAVGLSTNRAEHRSGVNRDALLAQETPHPEQSWLEDAEEGREDNDEPGLSMSGGL